MSILVPLIILGIGAFFCHRYADGVPSWLGETREAYTIIAIFFGIWAFETEHFLRDGKEYFDENGGLDVGFAFIVKPVSLFVYWVFCKSMMRR